MNQNGSTQYLYFHYKTYEHVLDRDQARVLILQLVDALRKQIHSKENFGSYFYYYPLEKGQLAVSISFEKLIRKGLLFFDDEWSPIEEPFIRRVALDRVQRVCYHVYDYKGGGKDTEYQEPLEKAQEIVHGKEEPSQEEGSSSFIKSFAKQSI